MPPSLFDYADYRRYLVDSLASGPGKGRGRKGELAAAAQVHSAYLSRVLSGDADFSLEQALRASEFFGHTPQEVEYFLLLVQHARAGSPELRALYHARVLAEQQKFLSLDKRLSRTRKITGEDRLTYYSQWHFAAIHVATAVPSLQTVRALSAHFQLSVKLVEETLRFLEALGLVVHEHGKYRIGETHLHAEGQSTEGRQHHINWRMRAIAALDTERGADVRYTSIIACSKKDMPRVQKVLVEAVQKVRAIVRDSKEEAVYCYLVDLFEVASRPS